MKTKAEFQIISSLIVVSLFCLLNSCSLIGFGIGASIDKKKPKTSKIYKTQIDTLNIGSEVEIFLMNGNRKYGKYGGIIYAYNSDGINKYKNIQERLANDLILPNQNDTLLIYLINDENEAKLGFFRGFESGKMWYKYFYSNDFSAIELSLIHNFTINNETNVDSVQINNFILEQEFPNLVHLKIDTKPNTIEYIPMIDINKIEATNKQNAKFVGLGIGLAIDAIIMAAAIKSMQNITYEMSF